MDSASGGGDAAAPDPNSTAAQQQQQRTGGESSSPAPPPSRYESQKRRDWNTFLQYLKIHKPPLTLARCSGAHVIEFLKYLDQFGKTKVHITGCLYFGRPDPPAPCACPLKQAWGSLDALIGRLRTAYEENGGRPESNPFGARAVRIYLREVREGQAKARGIGIPYEKKAKAANVSAVGDTSDGDDGNPSTKRRNDNFEKEIVLENQKVHLKRASDIPENEDVASTLDLNYKDEDTSGVELGGAHFSLYKEKLPMQLSDAELLWRAKKLLRTKNASPNEKLEAISSVLDQNVDQHLYEKLTSKQISEPEEAINVVGPSASPSTSPPEFPSGVKAYLLRELDFSDTNIKLLPESLPALVALQKLILKRCPLLMELPPQIGKLPNLEMLDLDETQVFYLPQEVGGLSKLKFLRVSFYGYKNRGMKLRQKALIHPKTISSLSQLVELSIDVNPDDSRWYDVVGYVIQEACSLDKLQSVTLYVPDVEILEKRKPGSTSLSCYPLHKFRLTVGHHKQRYMSTVPKKFEAHFQEWEKCVKFVKGEKIPNEMKKLLEHTKALYLDRHANATSLSDFGIENLQVLEFCLLEECGQIETILDGGKSSEGSALLNLEYLHIYLLESLVTIWRNPNNHHSLSRLKVLALHECLKLTAVFSVPLLHNLKELEVLTVDDCPEVISLVSLPMPNDVPPFDYANVHHFLPKLKTLLLLWLPNLVTISSGLSIAPKLENMGVYDCPKLESISTMELSSDSLEVIKGEKKWWEALKWDESEWESIKIGYLHSIFSPIQIERDVMSQMEEMFKSPAVEQSN